MQQYIALRADMGLHVAGKHQLSRTTLQPCRFAAEVVSAHPKHSNVEEELHSSIRSLRTASSYGVIF